MLPVYKCMRFQTTYTNNCLLAYIEIFAQKEQNFHIFSKFSMYILGRVTTVHGQPSSHSMFNTSLSSFTLVSDKLSL